MHIFDSLSMWYKNYASEKTSIIVQTLFGVWK